MAFWLEVFVHLIALCVLKHGFMNQCYKGFFLSICVQFAEFVVKFRIAINPSTAVQWMAIADVHVEGRGVSDHTECTVAVGIQDAEATVV